MNNKKFTQQIFTTVDVRRHELVDMIFLCARHRDTETQRFLNGTARAKQISLAKLSSKKIALRFCVSVACAKKCQPASRMAAAARYFQTRRMDCTLLPR